MPHVLGLLQCTCSLVFRPKSLSRAATRFGTSVLSTCGPTRPSGPVSLCLSVALSARRQGLSNLFPTNCLARRHRSKTAEQLAVSHCAKVHKWKRLSPSTFIIHVHCGCLYRQTPTLQTSSFRLSTNWTFFCMSSSRQPKLFPAHCLASSESQLSDRSRHGILWELKKSWSMNPSRGQIVMILYLQVPSGKWTRYFGRSEKAFVSGMPECSRCLNSQGFKSSFC